MPRRDRDRRPRRRLDDDLLSGFDRGDHPRPQLRGFFAATVSASLLAWNITFALGAYRTVFYSRLFDVLVISMVLLLGALVLRREVRVRRWMLAVLTIPIVWMLLRLLTTSERKDSWLHPLDLVLTGLMVATLPLTLFALIRIIAPEYFELPERRLKLASVGIVVIVSIVGYLVGAFNYRFVTCHSFDIAGDDTPANCQQDPRTH